MQTVGSACAICANKITYAGDATGCSSCMAVFHTACLSDPTTCQNCARPFARQVGSGAKNDPAKPEASKAAVFLFFAIFCGWLFVYLYYLRPIVNAWASQYVSSFPAFLHLVPIFGVLFAIVVPIGWLMERARGSRVRP